MFLCNDDSTQCGKLQYSNRSVLLFVQNRVGENFSKMRNFRPLTPPCVPFGTRRFNQLNK